MAALSSDLADIVAGVWHSEFNLTVELLPPGSLRGLPGPRSVAVVRIAGAWDGAIVLVCVGPTQGRSVGDLARMIADSLSALLPGRCILSPPETAASGLGPPQIPGAVPVLGGEFGGPGLACSVTLFQNLPTPRP